MGSPCLLDGWRVRAPRSHGASTGANAPSPIWASGAERSGRLSPRTGVQLLEDAVELLAQLAQAVVLVLAALVVWHLEQGLFLADQALQVFIDGEVGMTGSAIVRDLPPGLCIVPADESRHLRVTV